MSEGGDTVDGRLARLERTLLEVVTALGVLVGELGTRSDLGLQATPLVEDALERGWQTLFGAALEASDLRTPDAAPGAALARAMRRTGAAVGALYAARGPAGPLELVAHAGYPPGVMERFRVVELTDDLPVAAVARTRRPLWFAEREEIVERYPHLRDAHEETELRLARPGVQGAVLPLLDGDRLLSVVIVGFTADAASADARHADAVASTVVQELGGCA